ncbi:hypothetical protein HDU93_003543 [Gonapodya sp. JEL0774]|nr:hypothetical protein HDU93_003543 [Gonapodya sp. JEL0774]
MRDPETLQSSPGLLTLSRATFNLANYILSLIVIGAPFLFQQAGFIPALGLYLLYLVLMTTTASWLCRCVESAGKSSGRFPVSGIRELVEVIAGRGLLEGIVACAFFLDLYGTLVMSVTVLATHLYLLLPSLPWLTLPTLKFLLLPFLIFISSLPFRQLSITSFFGTFCAIGIVAVLFFDGVSNPTHPGSLHEPAEVRLWPSTVGWGGPLGSLAIAVGVAVTTTSGHSGLPVQYMLLQNRRTNYRTWLTLSFGTAVAVLCVCGTTGYLMFGDATAEQITENLFAMKENRILNAIITIFVTIIPITTFPLYLEPLAADAEAALVSLVPLTRHSSRRDGVRKHQTSAHLNEATPLLIDDNEFRFPYMVPAAGLLSDGISREPASSDPGLAAPETLTTPTPFRLLVRSLLRALLAALAVATSACLPSFINLVALLGALVTAVTAVIVPAGCFLALARTHAPKRSGMALGDVDFILASGWEIGAAWAVMLIGTTLAIFGTVGTIGRIWYG